MSYKFKCKRKREGDNADLCIDLESGEELWIPHSQIESAHFDGRGEGHMMITDWMADKKGLA